MAINNAGQIAGIALTSEEDVHAVCWDQGRLHELHRPSDAWNWARAINDAGHVGGRGETPDGESFAVPWLGEQPIEVGPTGPLIGGAYGINDACRSSASRRVLRARAMPFSGMAAATRP
jgi:uncharacterized membrane protein